MTTHSSARDNRVRFPKTSLFVNRCSRAMLAVSSVALLLAVAGCQTPQAKVPAETDAERSAAVVLREGDTVKITFPGAPNLNESQQIRRDGKIALSLVGEITAAGLTPADLEKEILKLYAPQLVTKEVMVTVVSSTFPIFVTGAVIRPGKILSDHPITALEAIMEAGGFDYNKADMGHVRVVRTQKEGTKNYTLNLRNALEASQSTPFYLKPSDIVYVPERFNWF
ncbi:MAG TPA: polysaccharide biosynthesis/export family protein [Verrucomicrobiae bacterium]|nr:polysaccharide biosynthesis/export family protein [Verrucomicrobiae bacterium]